MSTVNELNSRFTRPTEGIEIEVEQITTEKDAPSLTVDGSSATDIAYQEKYKEEDYFSRALRPDELQDPISVSRQDAENRVSKIEDRMEIFLYNLFPYETMSALGQVESIVDDPSINSALTTSVFTSISGLQKLKYFTPAELALTLGQNFYTLSFFRGISIKKGKSGNVRFPATLRDIYTGEVDIYYGRDQANENLIDSVRQYFNGASDISESANTKLASLKEDYSPRWSLTSTSVIETKKNSFIDQLDPKNFMSNRSTLLGSVLRDQVVSGDKWKANPREDEYLESFKYQQELRDHETDPEEYLINKSVLNILQRVNAFVGTSWDGLDDPTQATTEEFEYNDARRRKNSTEASDYLVDENVLNFTQRINQLSGVNWSGQTDSSGLTTEDFDYTDVEIRKNSTDQEDYLINDNVTNIEQRVVEDSNGSWKFETDPSQTTKESFTYRDALLRKWNTNSNDYLINSNVLNIRLRTDPEDIGTEESPRDALIEKGFLQKGEKWQVGAIYAIPVVATNFKDSLPPFFIPFEFNPTIDESGVEVKYQQTEILSRIGAMQTFTGVGSLSVTLNTKYFAVSHDGTAGEDSHGQDWMANFTLSNIQAIEFAYRSLAYPHYPEEQNIDQGYKYVKPPLIKVIMGDYNNKTTAPYSNLLTYQTDSVVEGRLQSNFEEGKKTLRTFIATNVAIKKDLENTPLYLDENKILVDTFGFEVNMTLIEVTPNYTDSLPDYKNYYTRYADLAETYVNQSQTNSGGESSLGALANSF